MAAQITFSPKELELKNGQPWPSEFPQEFVFDDEVSPVSGVDYDSGVLTVEQQNFDEAPRYLEAGEDNTDIVVSGSFFRNSLGAALRLDDPLSALYLFRFHGVRGELSNSASRFALLDPASIPDVPQDVPDPIGKLPDKVYFIRHIRERESAWNRGYGAIVRYTVYFRAAADAG